MAPPLPLAASPPKMLIRGLQSIGHVKQCDPREGCAPYERKPIVRNLGADDKFIAAQARSPRYCGNPDAHSASIGGATKVIAMPKVVPIKAIGEYRNWL